MPDVLSETINFTFQFSSRKEVGCIILKKYITAFIQHLASVMILNSYV
jgi:hypothetical protein